MNQTQTIAINSEEDNIISYLEEKGVVHLKNVFNKDQMDIIKDIYTQSWNEIKNNFPKDWITRKYKANCHKYDDFIGLDLYNNKKFTYYKNTEMLDMGKNRYDFIYNLDSINETMVLPEIITNIMDKLLQCEYDIRWGGLPVESIPNITDAPGHNGRDSNRRDSNGHWHRDAYSLFNNEMIDLALPPFYFTMLITLQYTDETCGGTEFILESHKLNLTNKNITNTEKLLEWIQNDTPERYIPTLNVGDICIFHGYTIHRGLGINAFDSERIPGRDLGRDLRRDMLYIVCKKNWYNDEPTENYNEK
jgi:hypothetical protein